MQLDFGECFLQCVDDISLRFEGDAVLAAQGTVDLKGLTLM